MPCGRALGLNSVSCWRHEETLALAGEPSPGPPLPALGCLKLSEPLRAGRLPATGLSYGFLPAGSSSGDG